MNDGAQANTPKAEDHVAIPKKYIIVAQTAGCLWLTAWAFFIFVASKDADSAWINRLALIGDSFGPLSALLTVAALFTTAVSTYVQIREFRNQIREMSESKQELGKQTEAMQSQLNEMRKQTANHSLSNAVNCLPFFVIKLAMGQEPQRQLRITNAGHLVYEFEWKSEAIRIIDSQILQNSPHRGVVHAFGDGQNKLSLLFRPLNINIERNGVALQLSYVLHSGHKIEESFTVYFDKPFISSRHDQVEQLRGMIWKENLVMAQKEKPPALAS